MIWSCCTTVQFVLTSHKQGRGIYSLDILWSGVMGLIPQCKTQFGEWWWHYDGWGDQLILEDDNKYLTEMHYGGQGWIACDLPSSCPLGVYTVYSQRKNSSWLSQFSRDQEQTNTNQAQTKNVSRNPGMISMSCRTSFPPGFHFDFGSLIPFLLPFRQKKKKGRRPDIFYLLSLFSL